MACETQLNELLSDLGGQRGEQHGVSHAAEMLAFMEGHGARSTVMSSGGSWAARTGKALTMRASIARIQRAGSGMGETGLRESS